MESVLEASGEAGGKGIEGQGRPFSRGKIFCWVVEKGSEVPLRTKGTYFLEDLKSRKYRASVRTENFPEKSQEALVAPGFTVNLDFAISP